MVTGFHQHHRSEWRQRSADLAPIDAWASGADMSQADWLVASYALDQEEHPMSESNMSQELTTLVQRGMDGDREVLPALRELLTTRPDLWMHLRTLGMQVEHAWIQVIAGTDLVAQEVLAQQLQMLKVELGGPVQRRWSNSSLSGSSSAGCRFVRQTSGLRAMSLSMRPGSNSGKIGHRPGCWHQSKP